MTTIKIRKDSWTMEQDTRLKDIVVENIKNGETISHGLEVAAKELNRTVSGCNYRWSNHLKKVYFKELSKLKKPLVSAKRQRKEASQNHTELDTNPTPTNPTQKDVITPINSSSFLEFMMNHFEEYKNVSEQNEQMRQELIQADEQLDEARMQISLYEEQLKKTEELSTIVNKLQAEITSLKKENKEYKESMEKVLTQAKHTFGSNQTDRLRLVSDKEKSIG